jgi:hypothetical protein
MRDLENRQKCRNVNSFNKQNRRFEGLTGQLCRFMINDAGLLWNFGCRFLVLECKFFKTGKVCPRIFWR